jgi:hypothetical protein
MDADQAVQTARTIDFATLGSLTGYTQVNFGTSTAAIQRKRLVIKAQASAGNSQRALYPPSANQLPASPWCVQVPVTLYGITANNLGGIRVRQASTLKSLAFILLVSGGVYKLHITSMNSEAAGVADLFDDVGGPQAVLAIGYDGTTFSFYRSVDGRDWGDAVFTQAAATFIGTGTHEFAFLSDSNNGSSKTAMTAFNNSVILNQATPVPHGQLGHPMTILFGGGEDSEIDIGSPARW